MGFFWFKAVFCQRKTNIMKRSNILLTTGLLLAASTAFAHKDKIPTCKSLRHSKLVEVGQEDEHRYVLIQGKKHIEYFGDKNKYIKSTIKWQNDCSYKLTVKESTVPDFPLKPGGVLTMQFTEYKNGVWHGKVTIGEESTTIEYKNVSEKRR